MMDVLFVLASTLVFAGAIAAFRRQSRVARSIWWAYLIFATVCVAYAIVSGILDASQVPDELLEHLSTAIAFYKKEEPGS